MNLNIFNLSVLGIALGVSAACGNGEEADDAVSFDELTEGVAQHESGMLDLACAETNKGRCSECRSDAAQRLSECFDITTDVLISGGYSPVSACERVGSAEHCSAVCSEPPDECRSYQHTFVPTGEANEAVLTACQAAKARDERCGETLIGPSCEIFAIVERTEAVSAYDCAATTECGAPAGHCFEEFHESNIAEQLNELCPAEFYSSSTMESLNAVGAWMNDAAVDALMECAKVYCGSGQVSACADAWFRGVTATSE